MNEKAIGSARVLEFLRDRKFHTLAEIEQECGVEGRSRLSDLRRQGHILERHKNEGATGKAKYSHRLVQTALERALQDDELAEPVSPQTPAGSAINNKFAQGGERTAAEGCGPTAAVLEDPDASDAGWRDLFPAESGIEALPPPSAQLELGVGS